MVRLGGEHVGELGLGAAQFAFRPGLARESAIDVVHAGIANGVRLIDTARAYTRAGVEGYAEMIIRDALAGSPFANQVLVATKGGHWREGDEFPIDARPAVLRQHCDASLGALGTERIGLYQLHWVDNRVPLLESVGALAELHDEGKIAHIGLSNVSIPQLELARTGATIASVQNRLGFDYRSDLLMARLCSELGIVYLAYMPLGGTARAGPLPDDPRVKVARNHQVSVEQVTLSWLRAQAPTIVPIVGSSSVSTIMDSAGSVSLELFPEERALLDQWGSD
jgi:pyridoxine 4-dehydrogenase